jgi:excisionase family DNA binding protein
MLAMVRAMFHTPKQIAQSLNLSLGTVYADIAAGQLTCCRFGPGRRAIRVTDEALQEYVKRSQAAPSIRPPVSNGPITLPRQKPLA